MFSATARLLASSGLAALAPWLLDMIAWPGVRTSGPLLVSGALHLAIGMATGMVLFALWLPVRVLGGANARRRRLLAGGVALLVTGLAARQALAPLVAWSSWPRWATLAATGASAVVATAVVAWGLAAAARPGVAATTATTATTATEHVRGSHSRWLPSLALTLLAGALLVLDRTVLSSVFEKTYSFVEGLGQLALALACNTWLTTRPATRWHRGVMRVIAVAGAAWLVAFASSRPLRRAIEHELPVVWEEPVHAARWMRRVRRIESRPDTPFELRRLAQKYDVHEELEVDERWLLHAEPAGAPAPAPAAPPWNVVVFFVDTLRADVARDAAVMPDTLAWMRDNQWFPRAYSTGSSTLLMLAPLFGCRYDATPADRPMLIDAASAAGMRTRLVIPRSAADYHRGHFPELRFPEEEIVPDVDKGHLPTARKVVDRSLAWLREERPERFFLWLYQFDVHSSGDLDDRYVEDHAREGGFSKVEGLHWRYRAAARGIDQSFTRLRAGLDELGLSERTVVLFVSDHGESLGKQNFWGHTTYLWESLIRVPLAMHVPGRAAHTHDVPVSTVDLGTTLARFIGPLANEAGCHGEDLLARADDEPRRFPILFSAVVDGQLARIGMLAGAERKLVVDLRDASARLLRVEDGSGVEEDHSSAERADLASGLGHLLRSPLYPRGTH